MTLKKSVVFSSNGKEILVDEKWLYLSQYTWHTHSGYAIASINGNLVYMHLLICPAPTGFVTDHSNRNSLDNRESNLEVVTKSEDAFNRTTFKNNQLKIRGVRFRIDCQKFSAQIHIKQKQTHLGLFDTAVEASTAYEKAREIFTTKI